MITNNNFSPPGPLREWLSHHLVCSALSTSRLHPWGSSAIPLYTWALPRSLLALSLHLEFGLTVLLLPPASVFYNLLVNLSSLILCMCLPIAVCCQLPSSPRDSIFRSLSISAVAFPFSCVLDVFHLCTLC